MAVWEVRAVHQYGDRFWENVWHIDVGSEEDVPSDVILAIKDFHVSVLLNLYELVKIVRRPVGTTDEFIEAIFNVAGGRSAGTSIALPLFNTVRLLLSGGIGRPGSKFLRGMLLTEDVAAGSGILSSIVLGEVEDAFNTLLIAMGDSLVHIVVGDPQKEIGSGAAESKIQERQLHRKRKKTI